MMVVLTAMALFFISISAMAGGNRIVVYDNNRDGFIRYVNFSFQAPSVNCSEAGTWEFVRGSWNTPGQWVFHNPREELSPGFYFFKNPCGLSNAMQIYLHGEMNTNTEQGTDWPRFEIEPGDVGLFIRGWQEAPINPGLPDSDQEWDYYLLAPQWGTQGSLTKYLSANSFEYLEGELAAAIVSSERGFLEKLIFNGSPDFYDTMVDQDDIIILIYYKGSGKVMLVASRELAAAKVIIENSNNPVLQTPEPTPDTNDNVHWSAWRRR